MTTTPQPLFILCPGRSFSSVICSVIGQHPEAFGLPEVNLFAREKISDLIDIDIPFVGIPGISSGLRRALSELMFAEQTNESIGKVDDWLAERRDWPGPRMFEYLRDLAAPRVVVDKSPANTQPQAAARLFVTYPEAKFLHISRHPRATCRSRHKAYAGRKRWDFLIADDDQEYWRRHHVSAMQPARDMGPDQYMFLHGEWFLENPRPVLKQICEWLSISTDKAAIDMMMKPEKSPFAVVGPDRAKHGNNRGFIENPHLRIGKVPEENLDDPLEWREPENVHFTPETRTLAHILGYAT